jgi:lysine 6-dehydrogenase
MRIVILGAGLMGRGAAFDFLKNPKVESVVVADSNREALAAFKLRFPDPRLTVTTFDASDEAAVKRLLQNADGVFCAVHYGFNEAFTRAAIATNTHLVDLGGNNDVVNAQLRLSDQAKSAGITVVPDCGLAPGMVSVLVAWGLKRFAWADTVSGSSLSRA